MKTPWPNEKQEQIMVHKSDIILFLGMLCSAGLVEKRWVLITGVNVIDTILLSFVGVVRTSNLE